MDYSALYTIREGGKELTVWRLEGEWGAEKWREKQFSEILQNEDTARRSEEHRPSHMVNRNKDVVNEAVAIRAVVKLLWVEKLRVSHSICGPLFIGSKFNRTQFGPTGRSERLREQMDEYADTVQFNNKKRDIYRSLFIFVRIVLNNQTY